MCMCSLSWRPERSSFMLCEISRFSLTNFRARSPSNTTLAATTPSVTLSLMVSHRHSRGARTAKQHRIEAHATQRLLGVLKNVSRSSCVSSLFFWSWWPRVFSSLLPRCPPAHEAYLTFARALVLVPSARRQLRRLSWRLSSRPWFWSCGKFGRTCRQFFAPPISQEKSFGSRWFSGSPSTKPRRLYTDNRPRSQAHSTVAANV